MQAENETLWRREAAVFSRYITGKGAGEQCLQLYVTAQQKLAIPITPREQKKLNFILRFPFFMGWIDGALAMVNPEHPIRKKLYVMFSILESSPDFHTSFLPQQRSGGYMITILWTGTRAIFNTLFGFILLPWI
jgi:hypothetical protein